MKKVILCATALLFGTMAFAQVPTAPTAQTVGPLLNTGGHLNAGQSIQNGTDNKVQVRQAGTSNSVSTEQDNGTGLVGGNLARIMQTGVVQPAVSAYKNAAEVLQSGDENQSTTWQQGDENNAYTAQGQTKTASALNKAVIQQGIADQAQFNFAAIEQDGDGNHASTLQVYDNNDAWTVQDGDNNRSMIVSNGGPNLTEGHLAQNEQVGNNNESSINQSGAGARNTARTFQDGDDNQAKQDQTTDAVAGGTGNTAIIAQGNVTTGFFFSPIWGDLQLLDDIASGSTGLGSVGGIAFQTQSGSDNSADIRQFGTDNPAGNYAEQNQSGSGNEAFSVQNLYNNPNLGGNYSRQDQSGTNSQAGVSQTGHSQKAYQRQSGDDNIALSTQGNGYGSLVNTYQSGDFNRVTTAQRGVANTTLVVQKGGNSYVAQQNLDQLGGGGNQIDVLQLGPNGNFTTDGELCTFPGQMDPTMDYEVGGFDLLDVCPGC